MPMSLYHWPMGTFAPEVSVAKEDSMQEINGNVPDARFWTSRKFWLTVLGAGVFLALALTKTMAFSNSEAITIILGLVGFNVGAHAATDIASLIAGRQRNGNDSDQGGTLLEGVSPEHLESLLTDLVTDVLEQALPDETNGGDSLRSPRLEGSPTPSRPGDTLPRNGRDTPIETPRPKDADEEDDA